MATTQEFYRLRGRNVRFSTMLQSMAHGMYLTDQNIPEGYAKVMVNYDIDDTGSCIRTRKGRLLHVAIPYQGYHKLGKMHLTDYLYTYDNTLTEIEDIKDVLLSFGKYGTIDDFLYGHDIPIESGFAFPMFASNLKLVKDTNIYNEAGDIVVPGTKTTTNVNNSWGLYCDRGSEEFAKIDVQDLGYVSARTVRNAYAFDKKLVNDLGFPIFAIMSNEIYCFSAPKIEGTWYTGNEDRSGWDNFGKPDLTKLIIQSTNSGYKLIRQVIEPKALNPTEAAATGYNILSHAPYVFQDVAGGAPRILSIIPYKDSNSDLPEFSLNVGTQYWLRIYYQYTAEEQTYEYKVETLDAAKTDDSYEEVVGWTTFTTGENYPLWIPFIPKYAQTLVRVTIRLQDHSETESKLPRLLDCTSTKYAGLQNKIFDLSTAKGMVSWFGCLGVYGVEGASDTIFFSDVEDPSYFPFPNNTITFDNEILAVHNYLDMLLVITTDSISLVSIGDTIATCKVKKLMVNIFIPELDAINAVVLKDQIFFKTDNNFYVLKNNQYTSDATDLRNYTNSTAIAYYTEHFTKETVKILDKVFRTIAQMESEQQRKTLHFTDFDVKNVQSSVKNDEVHYVYTIVPKIEDNEYGNLDMHLVYNTTTRAYRMYMQGIGDDDTSHTCLLYRNKQSGIFYEVIPYNLTLNSNILIVKEDIYGRDDNIIQGNWQLTPFFNNFNYFDTGNVAIDDTYLKRFREIQMNIINREKSKIKFFADVKIDGKLLPNSTDYQVQHITDPEDPEYGLTYVTPVAVNNLEAYGNTTLDCEDEELIKYWQLDLSAFPELDEATVRFSVFGKGRRIAYQLLCTELKNYELSTFVWVYRIMNVR